MPNYTSHMIMANHVLSKMKKNLKTEVSISDLSIASIGQDFTYMDSKLFEQTHNENVQSFFINLIGDIKTKKLQDTSKIMAYLYGHIAHFCLDSTLHPFIYAKEKETKKVTLFSSHTTIEYWIDDYLNSLSRKPIPVQKILKEEHFLDSLVKEVIDQVYHKTYQKKKASKTYQKTLWALKGLDYVSKFPTKGNTLFYELLNYKAYFSKNKISCDTLLNQNHELWISPFSGYQSHESLNDLYQKSIIKALELSETASQFLYGNLSLQKVKKAFSDISYDTGVHCTQGKKFIYTNKK